ncbi:hypothetical protein B0H13DRAFT_2330612 [Mycena leptocephala]|nr:hypothetical protein B0H13DRAFT_2330612 [Mycena leptocephala]
MTEGATNERNAAREFPVPPLALFYHRARAFPTSHTNENAARARTNTPPAPDFTHESSHRHRSRFSPAALALSLTSCTNGNPRVLPPPAAPPLTRFPACSRFCPAVDSAATRAFVPLPLAFTSASPSPPSCLALPPPCLSRARHERDTSRVGYGYGAREAAFKKE